MKDGDATVYVISQTASDWVTAEPSKFQKAVLDAGAAAKDSGSHAATAKHP
jgi:hypothetical protein